MTLRFRLFQDQNRTNMMHPLKLAPRPPQCLAQLVGWVGSQLHAQLEELFEGERFAVSKLERRIHHVLRRFLVEDLDFIH